MGGLDSLRGVFSWASLITLRSQYVLQAYKPFLQSDKDFQVQITDF